MTETLYLCRWCYRKFEPPFMTYPDQCTLCYNNPFRTKSKFGES